MSRRPTPCIVTTEEALRQEEIIKQLRNDNDILKAKTGKQKYYYISTLAVK